MAENSLEIRTKGCILNKFQFALSLQRQEKLWQIMGLNLSKQTMANWIQYAYRDYLKPLIGLMKKQLLRENILHADETPGHAPANSLKDSMVFFTRMPIQDTAKWMM